MCATVLMFLLVEGVCSRKSTEPLQFIKSLGRFLITWKIQTLGNSRGRILLGKKDSGGSFQTKIALSFIQKTNLFTYWPLGKTSSWWFHCIALTMVRRYIRRFDIVCYVWNSTQLWTIAGQQFDFFLPSGSKIVRGLQFLELLKIQPCAFVDWTSMH